MWGLLYIWGLVSLFLGAFATWWEVVKNEKANNPIYHPSTINGDYRTYKEGVNLLFFAPKKYRLRDPEPYKKIASFLRSEKRLFSLDIS